MLKVFSLDFMVGDAACELVTVNPSNRGDPENRMHFQHSHSGYELHYVSAGVLSMDCIGASYKLTAGQILIIPPGVYHYVRSVSEPIHRMDLLLEVGKGQRSKDPELNSFLQALHMQRPLLLEENDGLAQVLQRLQKVVMDSRQSDFLQRQWLKVLCQELVLLMGMAAKELQTEEVSAAYDGADSSTDRYIMDQFFNHNYHGNSDMGDLARELNISVRQTGRVLQKTYGKGFREKMNECRLAVALDLIRNTDKSMAEISELLGYGEPANFSFFVKRQTGKTPAQLRKEK